MEVKTKIKKTKNLNKDDNKKYTDAQLDRVIAKLSKEVNRGITRRNLMDLALGR